MTEASKKQILEIIKARTEIQNLYVITCGPVPPNPAELLSHERMKELWYFQIAI